MFKEKLLERPEDEFDPILPNYKGPRDECFVKEMIDSGRTPEAANGLFDQLAAEVGEAAKNVSDFHDEILNSEPYSTGGHANIKVVEKQADLSVLELTFGDAGGNSQTYELNKTHYDKLERFYRKNNDAEHEKYRQRLYCVLARYESLSSTSDGYQMAVPEHVFAVMNRLFGVSHECFASPLNCYFPSFCSLCLDTDRYFGSKGSFFKFRPTWGSFEANPPFVEEVMTQMVEHIIDLLQSSEHPLSFLIVVPGWDDAACKSYQLTVKSPFLRYVPVSSHANRYLILERGKHQYKPGMQHRKSNVVNARIRTFIFFMQNDAGAKKWPVNHQSLETMTQAFHRPAPLIPEMWGEGMAGGAM